MTLDAPVNSEAWPDDAEQPTPEAWPDDAEQPDPEPAAGGSVTSWVGGGSGDCGCCGGTPIECGCPCAREDGALGLTLAGVPTDYQDANGAHTLPYDPMSPQDVTRWSQVTQVTVASGPGGGTVDTVTITVSCFRNVPGVPDGYVVSVTIHRITSTIIPSVGTVEEHWVQRLLTGLVTHTPPCTAGGSGDWTQHYDEHYGTESTYPYDTFYSRTDHVPPGSPFPGWSIDCGPVDEVEEPGGGEGMMAAAVESDPCQYRGDELFAGEAAAAGLSPKRRWALCLAEGYERQGTHVCPCTGCGPSCPRYQPETKVE